MAEWCTQCKSIFMKVVHWPFMDNSLLRGAWGLWSDYFFVSTIFGFCASYTFSMDPLNCIIIDVILESRCDDGRIGLPQWPIRCKSSRALRSRPLNQSKVLIENINKSALNYTLFWLMQSTTLKYWIKFCIIVFYIENIFFIWKIKW